jgi:2-oxoglutarate dehydrogenase complex dehydrogenase (E1) component-like enzyme
VNPVALGKTRAKQDLSNYEPHQSLCVQLHGDAAFSGQGIVMESLQLAAVPGFTVSKDQVSFSVINLTKRMKFH